MNEKYVFISYKIEEYKQALEVRKHLEANYIPCWMAPMSIRGGMSYAQEIPPAIRGCSGFVLILSEKAQESKWVPRELDQAINSGKVILPYVIEDCPLRNDFSFYLSNVQRYDAFRDPEETLDRMTRDIQGLLGIVPPPVEEPEPAAPAQEPETPVPAKPPKTAPPVKKAVHPQKEKKSGTKKKWILPIILSSVASFVALILLLVFMGRVNIGGQPFYKSISVVRLEDVILTQKDINKFSKFREPIIIEVKNCTIQAQDLSAMCYGNLSTLRLMDCNLTDEQFKTIPFSDMGRLSELNIRGNPLITTPGTLESCAPKLKKLDISDTGIRSFQWLTAFTRLEVLRANRIGLGDTAFLEGMIYLEELCLSENGLTSLDGLSNTSKLSAVDLSHNSLTDVSVLARSASTLEVLHLEYNNLKDLQCLAEAEKLRVVYVDGNELTDLNELKSKEELRILSASHNQIDLLYGMSFGAHLQYLNLSYNQLQYVYPSYLSFADDSNFMLDLSNNRLRILKLPENCNYRCLALTGNPEADLSYLTGLSGVYAYFDLPPSLPLQSLKNLSFTSISIVNCPLDRRVEIEEGLVNEHILTEEEAKTEIAQKAEQQIGSTGDPTKT